MGSALSAAMRLAQEAVRLAAHHLLKMHSDIGDGGAATPRMKTVTMPKHEADDSRRAGDENTCLKLGRKHGKRRYRMGG